MYKENRKMCKALREIIEEENNKIIKQMEEENIKVIKQMEEEKADIIKDSERKINDAVTHKIIELFVKGKLDLEEAAHECNLTVEDFIHAKEDYESSALA